MKTLRNLPETLASYLLLIWVVFGFVACERQNPDYIAPLNADQYGDFKILGDFLPSDSVADLSSDKPFFFKARFNRPAIWTIFIRGLESGEVSSLTYNSQEINQEFSTWIGKVERPYGFRSEMCEATLSFPNSVGLFRTCRFRISAIKQKVPMGVVVADFEKGVPKTLRMVSDGMEVTERKLDSILGGKYYSFGGTDLNENFYVGECQFNATDSVSLKPNQVFKTGTNDSLNCILNFYVYGWPGGGRLECTFYENELGDQFNGYQNQMDDAWVRTFDGIGNWTGWRIISVRFADAQVLNDPRKITPMHRLRPTVGQKNADRICRIGFKLISGRGGQRFMTFDHVNFTVNQPFTY
jgi:hypothetical protein